MSVLRAITNVRQQTNTGHSLGRMDTMKAILTNKKTWLALALLAGMSALGAWQHKPILAWYYVRQLSGAYPDSREGWATKVAALEEVAVPRLLDGLRDPDAMVCGNVQ